MTSFDPTRKCIFSKPLIIVKDSSILDVGQVLNPSLHYFERPDI